MELVAEQTGLGLQRKENLAELGIVVSNLQETQLAKAQEVMQKKAQALRDTKEFPAGRIEIRDDLIVLADVPFSGGEIPLYGIERNDKGLWIVNYEHETSDYLIR